MGSRSFDEMWAQVRRDLPKSPARLPVGDGWVKRGDLPGVLGVCTTTLRRIVPQLIADGTLEVFDGTIAKRAGGCVPQTWYRPKAKKKAHR